MRTRVKICGITRIEDAQAAAHAGADAVGVNFWPGTPRRVDLAHARAIVESLPPFVARVGLFVDPSQDEVRAALAAVPLDALQFHGRETAGFCRAFGKPYLKAIAVSEGADLLECASPFDDAAGLLFDAFQPGDLPGGTGQVFDWSRLSARIKARLRPPLVLSGGLDPDNVARAIRMVQPYAVDVSSGVEARDADGRVRRGYKDAARIAAFMQGVRSADA
ncbi:MAG TPA: phosphoribosylanthranilate isomerase [Casimicrobiaceae bacterium]|jgi:phosphoribosylanthranilate isomerase